MSAMSKRLLEPTVIAVGYKTPKEDVLEVGAYTRGEIQFRRLKDGTTASTFLRMQHAATNDDDAFTDLKDVSANLVEVVVDNSAAGNKHVSVDHVLRFVRLVAVGATIAGGPVVLCDTVWKE